MTKAQRLTIAILQACEMLDLDPSKYEGANGIQVKPFLNDVIASDQISDDVRQKFIEVYQTLENMTHEGRGSMMQCQNCGNSYEVMGSFNPSHNPLNPIIQFTCDCGGHYIKPDVDTVEDLRELAKDYKECGRMRKTAL